MTSTNYSDNASSGVLLVEDNQGDISLIKEILADMDFPFRLDIVTNGDDALKLLTGSAQKDGIPVPVAVILDLNLPKKNGKEVLAGMKADPVLKDIPVFIFTSSQAEDDKSASSSLGATGYFMKPIDFEEYSDVIRKIMGMILNYQSN